MAVLNLVVDQTEFENAGAGFEPLPEGKYKVSIFDAKPEAVKQGPNEGKVKLRLQFKIMDGEKFANRRIFADVNTFGGVSGPNSKNPGKPYGPFDLYALAKAIGYSAEQLASLDTDELLGKELEVTVEHTFKRIQHDGGWVPSDELHESHPKYREVKETVTGYRSLKSAAKSAIANASGSSSKAAKYSL